MNSLKSQKQSRKLLFLSLLIIFPFLSFSQNADSLHSKISVHGAITATNNGISVIPTFMLGKPATIFDLVVAKNKFSFEPQFRFAIEDVKPWSFIFWFRYKLVQSEKFKMGIGAHPSTVFSSTVGTVNGVTKDLITVRRFWAAELTPTYKISQNVNVGIYYLYSRGLADATKNTNFVALSASLSNIKISNDVTFKIAPQLYYLQMDDKEGYYVTSTFSLAKRNFPISLSSIMNKKIDSTIPSEDFVWNISMTYSF
ncbi:hypothetical protein LV89_01503 [Arcicella aurantiaca]|uniref:Outer membrane protein n=1 Tax=Arcicella aurantiaca TaxID=591202 RepID=A0A316EB16_9BACT|nr:hypothetical protein [Arcicella aurantiaca]PWK27612.1 hypothetical protein LV89_01503 [Arcicella aurantiaca]